MILRELTFEDQLPFEQMLIEWSDDPGLSIMYGLTPELNFEGIVKMFIRSREGIDLADGLVPATSLFAFVGNEIVGKVVVRHQLNDHLLKLGGHIGYGVIPSHRGKGHASQMLKLALEYCQTLSLDKVLLTCDSSNLASQRIIEKAGGVFENAIDGKKLRYWINI